MIVVTGGAGFIGSNIIEALNQRGQTNILVVDDLTKGQKFKNLADLKISDYADKTDFITDINTNQKFTGKIKAMFHLGACSVTTEWNGQYMMKNNFEYSKILLHYCLAHRIPYIYASSAATYGAGTTFIEQAAYENPLNVYGYSKFLFDEYVRQYFNNSQSQIVGCRYFNVYGPREQHKGSMASVAYHLHQQLKENESVRLFEGCDGYGNGEQRRDFIYVGDAAKVNLWFLDHPDISGIYNVGTGRSQTFNEVAEAVIDWHQRGKIDYIRFPDHLKGCYQSFTEADLSQLRKIGYDGTFKTVQEGVKAYFDQWADRL